MFCTYVHVQCLAISPRPADCGGDDDELVFGDEVAYAALLAGGLVAWVGLDVELEGVDEWEEEGDEEFDCERDHLVDDYDLDALWDVVVYRYSNIDLGGDRLPPPNAAVQDKSTV